MPGVAAAENAKRAQEQAEVPEDRPDRGTHAAGAGLHLLRPGATG
jgi:hypothetical protein